MDKGGRTTRANTAHGSAGDAETLAGRRPEVVVRYRGGADTLDAAARIDLTLLVITDVLDDLCRHFDLTAAERDRVLRALAQTGTKDAAEAPAPAEFWRDRRDRRETPPDFIRRVYGDLDAQGLALHDIRQADRALYRAYYNWKRTHGLPPEDALPTKKQRNDRLLAFVEKAGDFDALSALALRPKEVLRLKAVAAKRAARRPKD